jgi:phosphoglycerate kinase
MPKVTIRDIPLSGQRVFMRVDFNVPLEEKDGKMVITSDTRIKETVPTIEYLIKQGARLILASHLGRPKGKRDPKQSLRPAADRLAEILKKPVSFVDDCIGPKVAEAVEKMNPGDVLVLENVRFYAQEEKNDPEFSKQLAAVADVYVNDAFGSAHRAHASTEGMARQVKTKAIGFLMERELKFLGDELASPARPFVVVLGGAKVSDKIAVIDALLEKADTVLIGGAMAYTFALSQGKAVGKSLTEPDKVDVARSALEKAAARGVKMLLPVDNLITDMLDFDGRKIGATRFTAPGEAIPEGWQGVDIGPETVRLFAAEVARAKTILWNGPMGVFEIKDSAKGTFAIAEAVATNAGARSIIGGGDSVKAVNKSGYASKVTFMSTGGGASLEFLEGKVLPGVAVIPDK